MNKGNSANVGARKLEFDSCDDREDSDHNGIGFCGDI